jgi:hypothetical protein
MKASEKRPDDETSYNGCKLSADGNHKKFRELVGLTQAMSLAVVGSLLQKNICYNDTGVLPF